MSSILLCPCIIRMEIFSSLRIMHVRLKMSLTVFGRIVFMMVLSSFGLIQIKMAKKPLARLLYILFFKRMY